MQPRRQEWAPSHCIIFPGADGKARSATAYAAQVAVSGVSNGRGLESWAGRRACAIAQHLLLRCNGAIWDDAALYIALFFYCLLWQRRGPGGEWCLELHHRTERPTKGTVASHAP